MKRALAAAFASVLLASFGCGGNATVVPHDGVGGGGTTSGTGAGGPGATPCPAAEPSGGESCAVEGFRCTYGDSPRPECRDDWLCSGGAWVTTKSICVLPPADHCSFTSPPSGMVCSYDGDVCVVGGSTICQCTACSVGPCMPPPPIWSCAGPPSTPGCPTLVPNDGSPCDAAGLECTYGIPCGLSGAIVVCKSGTWLWDTNIACAQ